MQFYTFDETTYPGIPDHVGPESKLTNRFCDPALAAQTYHEHLDEWALYEELGFDGALVNEHHFTYFKLKILERCGHLPMVEKPETFHRLLYDFLVGVEEKLPDVVQV